MEEIGTWRSPSGEVGTESMYGAIVPQPRLESMQSRNLRNVEFAAFATLVRNSQQIEVQILGRANCRAATDVI